MTAKKKVKKKVIKSLSNNSIRKKDCAACRGRHRAHTCGKQKATVARPFVKGCPACAGQHRAHTCG